MKFLIFPTTVLCSILLFNSCGTKQVKINYPETKKIEHSDNYFGTDVKDPYRWLEDDNSAETEEWVKAQNKVTFEYLNNIPFRNKMKDRLLSQWDYPKTSAPFKVNERYMMFKNSGLQNQSVLYLLDNIDDKEGTILLDPNTLSDDGTVALTDYTVSKDNKTLIYSIARGGSDWNEIFFLDIDSKKPLDDHIKWIKFSGLTPYKDGVIYSRYPEPKKGDELSAANENAMVYYHKIGTDQSEDVLLYSDPKHPLRSFGIDISDDDKYAFLYTSESTSGNALAFKKVDDKDYKNISNLEFKNDYYIIDVIDDVFYMITNENASNYKIVAVDPKNPTSNWKDIIPEKDYKLGGANILQNKIFAQYIKDAYSKVEVYDLSGKYLYDVDIEIGSVGGFGGKNTDTTTFYSYTSYYTPAITYKYDIVNNKSEEYDRSKVKFDSENYTTEQVFFTSKDGTKVPMFITYNKNIKLDGKNPTLLYGYGGFNISLGPRFSTSRIPLLENNGILVEVNLRGGGEYGKKWHEQGTLMNKQNVFDDCIAAAEYLIEHKYTSPEYLAIQGGSNGGLLVGAVVNQRPDLFKVALPAVGVMDMLRYHKFTIGRHWATDYGTSEDSKEMFEYLYSYSPLHNIKPNVEYPAILVTTGDHDDRVVPAHSFKYAATLQDTYKGNNPVLIRIETMAGHGSGKPTEKIIEEITDEWAFMFYNMGITPKF